MGTATSAASAIHKTIKKPAEPSTRGTSVRRFPMLSGPAFLISVGSGPSVRGEPPAGFSATWPEASGLAEACGVAAGCVAAARCLGGGGFRGHGSFVWLLLKERVEAAL